MVIVDRLGKRSGDSMGPGCVLTRCNWSRGLNAIE